MGVMRWYDRLWQIVARGSDAFGFWGIGGVSALIALAGTVFASLSERAPILTSVGWLFVFFGATLACVVILGASGWAYHHWRPGTNMEAPNAGARAPLSAPPPRNTPVVAVGVLDPTAKPLPQAQRPLSTYEIEKKLRVLDQFLDFLNTEMRPTVDQAGRVRDLAWEVFRDRERNASYQDEMATHIRMVRDNFEAFDRLRGLCLQYPDIMQATEQTYGVQLEVTASDYKRMFAILLAYLRDNTPHQHFWEIMSDKRAAFDSAVNAFKAWRQSTINTLAEMRRKLAP